MNSALIPIAAIFGLGGPELILIFAVLLLLFGGAKLPSLAKGLGQSIREFKKASTDNAKDEDEKKVPKSSKKKEPTETNGSN